MIFGFRGRGGSPFSLRQTLLSRVMQARINLVLVFAFTAVNIVLLAAGSGTYFLFSASVPYFIALIGAILCGSFPPEYYTEAGILPNELLPSHMMVGFILVAMGIAALYLLAFLLSKKRPVWLLVALVFFVIDTVAMFLFSGLSIDMLLDLLFHVWVLVELILGVRAVKQLKTLPADFPEDGIPFVNPISPDDRNTPKND